MAQVYSPWFDATPAIQHAFLDERYPPLFPALLAVTGASHSLLLAHLLVVVCFLAALLRLRSWACQALDSRPLARWPAASPRGSLPRASRRSSGKKGYPW